jgi:tRNA(fMet)-specific endonuclease VapC
MLDSNICIYILEGKIERLRAKIELLNVGAAVTSSIVYAEVMRGIDLADTSKIAKANRMFEVFAVQSFDQNAASYYAGIPFKRGSFDRLIAAHVLALGLTLVTNNEADFADVPGLKVENWTV